MCNLRIFSDFSNIFSQNLTIDWGYTYEFLKLPRDVGTNWIRRQEAISSPE